MKRRDEFLVIKRDGRREWLRASKLARSIQLALQRAGAGETWRALELATTVLTALRARWGIGPIRAEVIAAAAEHVMSATGHAEAACAYSETGAELRRRQRLLAVAVVPPPDARGVPVHSDRFSRR